MWDASGFSCEPHLLSLLQEEEEEPQMVEDVEYSIYGAGKNNRGKSAGRSDCVGLRTGAGWDGPCGDQPVPGPSGELGSLKRVLSHGCESVIWIHHLSITWISAVLHTLSWS